MQEGRMIYSTEDCRKIIKLAHLYNNKSFVD